jgi:hypothetical protein
LLKRRIFGAASATVPRLLLRIPQLPRVAVMNSAERFLCSTFVNMYAKTCHLFKTPEAAHPLNPIEGTTLERFKNARHSTRLSRQVPKQFGTSVFPVSEAILRLESEGLVESKPQVGTRVRVPSETDIRDGFIIREALECQSARLVATGCGTSDL